MSGFRFNFDVEGSSSSDEEKEQRQATNSEPRDPGHTAPDDAESSGEMSAPEIAAREETVPSWASKGTESDAGDEEFDAFGVEDVLMTFTCARSDCLPQHHLEEVFEDAKENEGALHPLHRRVDCGQNSTFSDLVRTSDLRPGVYEGGFKLWECAVDLVRFLLTGAQGQPEGAEKSEEKEGEQTGDTRAAGKAGDDSQNPLRGRRVLELGCGHGLPGLVAAQSGAAEVIFQDYNAEVLELVTAHNLRLNLAEAEVSRCRFISGGWSSMAKAELVSPGSIDVLFATDCIYNERSYADLIELIRSVLARPHGVALIAAKSFYFGVGGSLRRFLRLACLDGQMSHRTVVSISDGHSNVRELVELSWSPPA
jgi:SAM-dependent methyltransferase